MAVSIKVFAQPWFQGAVACMPLLEGQRNMRITDLLDDVTGLWDVEKLIRCFGYEKSMQIIANVQAPVRTTSEDRLIFLLANNGVFSVKKAYNSLMSFQNQQGDQHRKFWEMTWKRGTVLPRVSVFLWKLNQNALPLKKLLNIRFPSMNPVCESCGGAEEDVQHMMFKCDFSRLCWFAGPLGLRSQCFTGSFRETLSAIGDVVDDEKWLALANSMWAIWRCRNDCAYAGKIPGLQHFLTYLSAISEESLVGATRFHRAISGLRQPSDVGESECCDFVCYLDGSWTTDWYGGVGCAIFCKGDLVVYKSAGVKVCSLLQAEAVAMKEAISLVQEMGIQSCIFYTDNTTLAGACSRPQPPTDSDWKAFSEMMDVWKSFKKKNRFYCSYVQRSQNDLADFLAKMGRIQGWSLVGFTYPILEEFRPQ